jgi:hypothetical protein
MEAKMQSTANIREHMEVLGSDGQHVGTVDHVEGSDRIKLTKTDPKSGGEHHFIQADWIDHIDQHVHLNKKSSEVMSMWQKH